MRNRQKIEGIAFSGTFNTSKRKFRQADKYPKLDEALLKWFIATRSSKLIINDELMKRKADSIVSGKSIGDANLESIVSLSWIQRWKNRHNIALRTLHGESGGVSPETIDNWTQNMIPLILQQFEPANIFNGDETGLFWKLTPSKSLTFFGEKCHGGKHSKERITIFVAASATGEKLPLLVIGKSAKPRALRNKNIPVKYKSSSKAWMNSNIFIEHVRAIDRTMTMSNRKIALIIDNCPAHPVIHDLNSVTLIFLPPNSTSMTQPMDCGVIWCFKTNYRRFLLTEQVNCFDSKKPFSIDLFKTLTWLKLSWDQISEETIVNCFHKSGIKITPRLEQNQLQNDISILGELTEIFQKAVSLSGSEKISIDVYNSVDNEVIATDNNAAFNEEIKLDVIEKSGDNSKLDESSNDSDIVVPQNVPTHAETLESVNKIHLYFTSHPESNERLQFLDMVQTSVLEISTKKRKQLKLEDYFQKRL